jgi:hypothetical protein
MLGPLEVRTDDDSGIVLDVGGSRLRALLIMLALRPGQLVPASQLIDGLSRPISTRFSVPVSDAADILLTRPAFRAKVTA